MKIRNIVLAAGLLVSGTTHAGAYSDSLAQCITGKSTMDDHIVLVRWMFVAMSQHPAVASLGKVTGAQVDKANQQMGELFTRLMTVTCRDQAKLALKNEGGAAVQEAFSKLGQQAGAELFINPDVVKGMSGMSKYFDSKKLDELRGP